MKTYRRILGYAKPYWLALSGSIFCILWFTLLSGASLVSVVPFLNTLFPAPAKAPSSPIASHPPQPLQLPAELSQRQEQLMQTVYQWLLRGDRQDALLRLCGIILL